jgi:uncharacterized protein YecE (DUF72 family)
MNIVTGTSGWQDGSWSGSFYPERMIKRTRRRWYDPDEKAVEADG